MVWYLVWMEAKCLIFTLMESLGLISNLGVYFSIIKFKSQSMQIKDIKCFYGWNFVELFLLRIFTRKSACLIMTWKIPVKKLTNYPMLNPIDNLNLVIVNFFYFKKNQEHSIFLSNFMIIETIYVIKLLIIKNVMKTVILTIHMYICH